MYQLLLPRSVLVVIPGRITSTIQHFSKKGGGNLILQKPPQYPTHDYSLKKTITMTKHKEKIVASSIFRAI